MIFLRIFKRIVSTFFVSNLSMEDYFYFWAISLPVIVLGWFLWGITMHNTQVNSCYLETNGDAIIIRGARRYWSDVNMTVVHSNQEAIDLMVKIPICQKQSN